MIAGLNQWWHQFKGHRIRFANIHDVLIGGKAAAWLVLHCSCGKSWEI